MAMKSKTAGKAGTKPLRGTSSPGLADKNGASAPRAGRRSKDGVTAVGGTDPAYLNLIQRLPLRPIRTEAELDEAALVIDELTDRNDLSESESDHLDVLGDIVEKYENEYI